MSLVIDSNLEYLQNILHISRVTFEEKYANMSVEEIIEAEAASGNQQAVELAQELTTNTSLIMELFDLADTNNKYMILRELTAQQLQVFLPEMEESDMLQGLFYFSQDKLMNMLEELPSEQLVNTAFELFSKEEIVQLMPEEQLDKFLTSTDIDKNKILKHMQSIPEEYVAQVLEQITGEAAEGLDSIELSKKNRSVKSSGISGCFNGFSAYSKTAVGFIIGQRASRMVSII